MKPTHTDPHIAYAYLLELLTEHGFNVHASDAAFDCTDHDPSEFGFEFSATVTYAPKEDAAVDDDLGMTPNEFLAGMQEVARRQSEDVADD